MAERPPRASSTLPAEVSIAHATHAADPPVFASGFQSSSAIDVNTTPTSNSMVIAQDTLRPATTGIRAGKDGRSRSRALAAACHGTQRAQCLLSIWLHGHQSASPGDPCATPMGEWNLRSTNAPGASLPSGANLQAAIVMAGAPLWVGAPPQTERTGVPVFMHTCPRERMLEVPGRGCRRVRGSIRTAGWASGGTTLVHPP